MVINCQLFIEMHNFFNYKMMSVLIPASGLSFCSAAPVLPGEQAGAGDLTWSTRWVQHLHAAEHQHGVCKVCGCKRFSIRFFCPCTSLGHPLWLQQQILCLAVWRRWQERKVGGHVMCLDKNVQETEPKKSHSSLFYARCSFVTQPLSQRWFQALQNISS